MAIPRRKLREIVFHLLYSADFQALGEDTIPLLMQHHRTTKKNLYDAQAVVNQFMACQATIDELIGRSCIGYAFNRIPSVEKNILRLGAFEILHVKDVAAKVVISEAIRLTRKFATAQSADFVNAVLDAILKKMV